MKETSINLPLNDDIIKELKAGDKVLLNGIIYTGRDAAHKRMIEDLKTKGQLPVDLKGQTIYYVGPCPAKPGEVIGSAGPTTSGRMDKYAPVLLDLGLKGMIGKGKRDQKVIQAMMTNKAVYFGAIGGTGALLKECIKSCDVMAYADLGPEAIMKLMVKDFPVTVIIDSKGNNLYETEYLKYQKK